MRINIYLDEWAQMPRKAHKLDAGYDLYSREDAYIPHGQSHFFDTGVHIDIPEGYAGEIKSKSGLNRKHKLFATGLIDAGYTGSIGVELFNLSPSQSYKVRKGDKITQIVIKRVEDVDFELTDIDDFTSSERGQHGFGSSGR